MDKDVQAGVTVIASGAIGIILASILYVLYENGTIVDEFVTGSITISEVMAIVIIVFLILGVILAVATK